MVSIRRQRGISARLRGDHLPDGYVLTNNHVVGDNSTGEITVIARRTSGRRRRKLIGIDPATDIALLKIDGQNLPTIPWGDSTQLKVGEWVLAIGSPFQLSQTVTPGIVSAHRTAANVGFAELRGLHPDRRGDQSGQLRRRADQHAAANWSASTPASFSESGGYQGIGFAVPSNLARHVVDDLMKYGEVRRGTIGYVQLTELTPELAREVGLQKVKGLIVWRMSRTSPAYQAGLRPGDVVDSVNGTPVSSRAFDRTLFEAQIGSVLRMGVIREGKPLELRVPIVSESTRRPQGVALSRLVAAFPRHTGWPGT